jgi:hypoxanthine phosphoribosyltransferase
MTTCKICHHKFQPNVVFPIWCKCGAIYDAPDKPRGLGDSIAKVTEAMGIKPCGGCKKRQDKLNRLFPKAQPPRVITLREMQKMATELSTEAPTMGHVVGVPRSGMIPASIIATLTHSHLWQLEGEEIIAAGHGQRFNLQSTEPARILIVDDSAYSGTAMRKAKEAVQRRWPKCEVQTMAMVVHSSAVRHLTYYHTVMDQHYFEWNFPNAPFAKHLVWDMDGVLCPDFKPNEDDDGKRYLKAMQSMPLTHIRPVKHPLTIITARLEKYRLPTMKWLEANGYVVEKLIMAPWADKKTRDENDITTWKAKQFNELPKDKTIYIESHAGVARHMIEQMRAATCICTSTGEVHIKR